MTDDKNKKSFEVVDFRGTPHLISIMGVSAVEKNLKRQKSEIENALANDMVPFEVYHLNINSIGTTVIRFGEDIFHFGIHGWDHRTGTHGLKGYLYSNPAFKKMHESTAGLGVPPFHVGLTFLFPKFKVENIVRTLKNRSETEGAGREKFNFFSNNCIQSLLKVFEEADVHLGRSSGFTGFSSGLTFRNLFLDPPLELISTNIYPMSRVDMPVSSFRYLFPHRFYRYYSIQKDRTWTFLSRDFKEKYRDVMALRILDSRNSSDQESLETLFYEAGIVPDIKDFKEFITSFVIKGWVTEEFTLTPFGQKILDDGFKEFAFSTDY